METKIDFTGPSGMNRSLTIIYPKDLVTIIKDPRSFYKYRPWEEDYDDDEDEGGNEYRRDKMYPDVLLIPNNGVRIAGYYYYDKENYYSVTDDGKRYLDNTKTYLASNGPWNYIQSSFDNDTDVMQMPRKIPPMHNFNLLDLTSKDVTQVDERCKYQQVISFRFSDLRADMDDEKIYFQRWGKLPGNLNSHEYELHIIGEIDYFTANTHQYFAIGWTKEESSYYPCEYDERDEKYYEGDESCICYFNSWLSEEEVTDPLSSLEFTNSSLTKPVMFTLEKRVSNNPEVTAGGKKYQYGNMAPALDRVRNYDISEMPLDNYMTNGFRSSANLGSMRISLNHPNLQFRGSKFKFSKEDLAAVRIPVGNTPCNLFKSVKVGTDENGVDKYETQIIHRAPQEGENYKFEVQYDKNMCKTIERRQAGAGVYDYLILYRKDLKVFLNKLIIQSNLFKFTDKCAYGTDKWISSLTEELYAINGKPYPIIDGILIIEPIFMQPVCEYLNLCTTHDPNGAMSFEKSDETIKTELEMEYKDQLKYTKVDSWGRTTVRKEIENLRDSGAAFKVLFIKAHGGNYDEQDNLQKVGRSYSLLDKNHHQIFDFDDMKCLLQNKSGKYLIVCNSCHGGGLVEDVVHADYNDPSYTSVSPSSDLKPDYMFIYEDCANSPAWTMNGGLFRFDSTDLTYDNQDQYNYEVQTENIRNLVRETRTKNISELASLLSRQYSFLKSSLKMDKLFWTDETYSQGIGNANNLIIAASKHAGLWNNYGDGIWNSLVRTYPIIFIIWRVFGVINGNIHKGQPNIWEPFLKNAGIPTIEEFTSNPNLFKWAALTFSNMNPKTISTQLKYLLMSDESINRALEGDDIEENVKSLNKAVEFFYDCFCTWKRMSVNALPLKRITRNSSEVCLDVLFLDDIPGVVINGLWPGYQFPDFPGSDEVKRIDKHSIGKLQYRR